MAEITGPAGTDDTIAATVAAAMTAGMARVQYIEQDTLAAGDSTGDVMPLPPVPVSANYGSALNPASTDWPAPAQVPVQQGGSLS